MSKHDLANKAAGVTTLAAQDYGDFAGKGFENVTSEDVSVAFLNILQALSPECSGDKATRLPGAEPGMLINSATNEIWPGEIGVIIQPCATSHVFTEWKPRKEGGGFLGTRQIDDAVVTAAKEASTEYGKFKNGNNELVETFYIAALLHQTEDLALQAALTPQAIILAFTSTKIKSYRPIISRLRTFMNGVPPLFAHRLRVKTTTEKNEKGIFSNFVITPLLNNDLSLGLIPVKDGEGNVNPLITQGHAFSKAYNSGRFAQATEKQEAKNGGVNASDVPF